jgi:tetraacyldisaccharide 4'-kinase
MDERWALAILSGKRRDPAARMLRGFCAALTWPYRTAIAVRNFAYDHGWLRREHLSVPVISVGNLTTGGTGKTPLVAWLVETLRRRGYRPGILSRGYRSLAEGVNDEALVLERLCPGTPHLQQRDRVAGGRRAIAEDGCDVLILDDGFQHRRLARELDLVVIDALRPFGFGHLLPRGLLREPVSSLARADIVVVTRASPTALADTWPEIAAALEQACSSAACVFSEFTPNGWTTGTQEQRTPQALAGRRFAAFCGVGHPEGFFASLAAWGEPVATRVFPDHHHYTPAELEELRAWRESLGVELLVTTLKDLVKLPASHPLAAVVWALDIRATFHTGLPELERLLDGICPVRGMPREGLPWASVNHARNVA